MKIVFMGTPDFAVSVLKALINSSHEVIAVVTQEDKPKGRGKELSEAPVKRCAREAEIPVFQPARIKTAVAVETLRSYNADIFVVAAYGQILSKEILEMPPFGCINVHASLLPKYRGAAPIQWAIIDGEKETGVTIMQMEEGLDTGDMLLKAVVPIESTETGGSLHDKLAKAGAELCIEALNQIEKGSVVPVKQNDADSCYAKMLTKSLGLLQFDKGAEELERLIRGLDPWPGTYTYYHGKTLKIWSAAVCDEEALGKPGTVAKVTQDAIYLNTAEGLLQINELQLEGKKRMTTEKFLLGCKVLTGESLDSQP